MCHSCGALRLQDTYGPPMGKRLVIFLDDLNMPRLDQYGTQQVRGAQFVAGKHMQGMTAARGAAPSRQGSRGAALARQEM